MSGGIMDTYNNPAIQISSSEGFFKGILFLL
jgi:hypothetical protein